MKLQIAISDVEVDHVELHKCTELSVPNGKVCIGLSHEFAYKLCNADGSTSDEEIVVPRRVQNDVLDTAIAVYPQDPSCKALRCKSVVHPFALSEMCESTIVQLS
jgi:valyl-tRNA synthetase